MLQEFQKIDLFTTAIGDVIINILVALVCGFLISLLYRLTYKGPGYSITFLNSIILLSMITAIVIMVIGNSLARAFGLVGAMSIIRFRTAVKDTQDIVFIFFSLAIGMAAGVGYYLLAFTGTIFIGLVVYGLSKTTLPSGKREEYLLQFSFYSTDDEAQPAYIPVFKQYCRRYKIVNVSSQDEDGLLELSYYINLKEKSQNKEFVQAMQKISGVKNINLFFDNEQF